MKELTDLFLEELADIYNAEIQLTKALPKMAKAAHHDALRDAFESHLSETENQVERLKSVFKAFGKDAKAKKCKAMEGLLEEGKEIMSDHKGEPTIDAALISAAQKVEHYEIASYGCLCTWAKLLGNKEALQLLKSIMAEEEAADEKLTALAESECNPEAADGTSDGDRAPQGMGRRQMRPSRAAGRS